MAEGRADDGAHQRTVAFVEQCEFARRIEKLIQRTVAAQYAVDDVGGDAAHGEAGNIAGRFTAIRNDKSSLREGHGYAKSEAMPTAAPEPSAPGAAESRENAQRPLTPEAERALAEAAARRAQRSADASGPQEI